MATETDVTGQNLEVHQMEARIQELEAENERLRERSRVLARAMTDLRQMILKEREEV